MRQSIDIYTQQCIHREFCHDLEGWDGGVQGRLKREVIYMWLGLICTVIRQKLMH